jgi:hypothetical protein
MMESLRKMANKYSINWKLFKNFQMSGRGRAGQPKVHHNNLRAFTSFANIKKRKKEGRGRRKDE